MARNAPADSTTLWQRAVERCPALLTSSRLVVGFSGGLDSTVLLHLLLAWRSLGLLHADLRAVHVHHGLQALADDWLIHAQQQCGQWQVPFSACKVTVERSPGLSVEEAARQARYGAFAESLAEGETLVLAHHADDQAETLLLHLLRGSGLAGLAGIPLQRSLGKQSLLRPLLGFTRSELQRYAEQAGLQWVDDPSNADTRHDRNFLRQRVLPVLQQRWPATSVSLARSAMLHAEAAELLYEVGAGDLDALALPFPNRLPLPRLAHLSEPRRKLLVRHWLQSQAVALSGRATSFEEFDRTWRQLVLGAGSAFRTVAVAGGLLQLHRYRGTLTLLPPLPAPAEVAAWNGAVPLQLPAPLGVLHWFGDGVELSAPLQVRFGVAGLRVCKPDGHHHSLQHHWQQQGVPPWLRHCVPLVFLQGELVAIGEWPVPCETVRSQEFFRGRLRWERSHLLCGW